MPSGRSVIITGAARNIGKACARRFAAAGDRVLLADEDEDAGCRLLEELLECGTEAVFVHAGVTTRLDVHNIMAEALDAYGRVDGLVHTAGECLASPFLETDEAGFENVLSGNLRGTFLINQAVARHFAKRKTGTVDMDPAGGSIVNTGIAVPLCGDNAAFAAAQAGVRQLTKSVAAAMSAYGVRVNMVSCAAVGGAVPDPEICGRKKDATLLDRTGDPQEVAEVVFFLAGEGASFMTGQCIHVDGGSAAIYG